MNQETPNFEEITRDEASARRYLLRFCWKNHQRFCPRCHSRRNYRLKNGRRRCARCRYTFHDFSSRWINNCNLTCVQWLHMIRLFQEEKTARTAAKELGVSYNTAYKAMTTIRFAILAHALDAKQLLGQNSVLGLHLNGRIFRGNDTAPVENPTPVFGIMDRGSWAFVDLLPGFDIETILHFSLNFQLKTVRLGNVIYTDRYQRYDTLICCVGNAPASDYFKTASTGLPIDKNNPGFWEFVSARLTKFHGVTPQRFPLYLKELELRYNSRHKDLFTILTSYLCDFVPEVE
ncbi:transposase [Desulfobaculum bizertense]|uniref:Transposase n=1 Tax=Desulfobaculum bizertense DSM 18034 TaxID=1121442 RepID=A0A1T4WNE3_9BACT|nr:transposase [Desulfobaculum bizertense]UIJ39331.1 IS1595 family transposase [Desulfobaculum bizertense]SKA78844.1 transposase [Desulfobaculum bizertense DSM 18034]